MMQNQSLGGWRRFVLWVILVTGIAILLNLYLYEFRIARNAEEARMLSQQADQYEWERNLLEQSDDAGEWNEDTLQRRWKEMPPTDQLPQFLLDLTSVERAAGVTVDSIDISAARLYRSWAEMDSVPDAVLEEAAYGEAGSSRETNLDPFIQPSLSQEPAGIYELPLVLKLTGTYSQAVRFMEQLHQLERTVVISNWRLTGVPEESGQASADVSDEEMEPSVSANGGRKSEQTFFIELNCSIYFTKQLATEPNQ